MPTPAKFAETPHQRMIWEATPGPITPGHETPGHDHETPGRGNLSARKRWDETPRTERETLNSSGWAETPKVDRNLDEITAMKKASAIAAEAANAKKRSRWDETPVGNLVQQTPQMMTPSFGSVNGTPSYPDFTPSGATPSGAKAMNLATPLPSQIPMTPEQMQAYRWEKEIDDRNKPYSDEELDAMFPPGYKVFDELNNKY
jgi:splicing factor 3B subunit 1